MRSSIRRCLSIVVSGGLAVAAGWVTDALAVSCQNLEDVCTPDGTSCSFHGLHNVRLGQATLSIVAGRLVVTGIGDGDDGVRVIPPPAPPAPPILGDPDPWIPMGFVAVQRPAEGSTSSGDRLNYKSSVSTSSFDGEGAPPPGSAEYSLRFTDVGPASIEIQPIFPAPGGVKYEVFLNSVSVAGPIISAAQQPAHAAAWPDTQAFSVVTWNPPTNITLPGGSPVLGDRLEIIPQGAAPVTDVAMLDVTGTAAVVSDLNPLRIIDERFVGFTIGTCVPALSGKGIVVAALLLLGGLAIVRRRTV